MVVDYDIIHGRVAHITKIKIITKYKLNCINQLDYTCKFGKFLVISWRKCWFK